MTSVDPRLETILLAIVQAYRVEAAGRRESLRHMRVGAMGEIVAHTGWPTDGPSIGRADLEDLEELGFVRVRRHERHWSFAPTSRAIDTVATYERELRRAERVETVDVSWAAVRPVLHALVVVWERNGAPPASIAVTAVARELGRPADDLGLLRAIELLELDGWVEADYELGTDGPIGARPLAKALRGARGWPGPDGHAAAERLLSVLEELEAEEPDASKRTGIRRTREFLLDLGSVVVPSEGDISGCEGCNG